MIADELNAISAAMQEDEMLAWSWHCNIAMSAQDEGVDHQVSNRVASLFMKLVFGVDTENTSMWKSLEKGWN